MIPISEKVIQKEHRLDVSEKVAELEEKIEFLEESSLIQEKTAEISAPSENAIRIGGIYHDRDIAEAKEGLLGKEVVLLEKGLQKRAVAQNTVMPDELEKMIKKHESREKEKENHSLGNKISRWIQALTNPEE